MLLIGLTDSRLWSLSSSQSLSSALESQLVARGGLLIDKKVKVKGAQSVRLFATPWTIEPMEFSRPDQNTEVGSLSLLQGIFLTS